jgi:hypothetical protein
MKKTAGQRLALLLTLAISLAGCQSPALSPSPSPSPAETPPPRETDAAEVLPGTFAVYREVPVSVEPSVAAYKVAPDLSNVTNAGRFTFSPEAEELLSENGFVVVGSPVYEFFSVYEGNRYEMIPNFVTTDAMLHNYHLYFSHLLRTLEKDRLRDELLALSKAMLGHSREQYQALQGTDWENAAKRNVAYFSVAACLLDADTAVPDYVRQEVEAELSLIEAHGQLAPSPVMNLGYLGTGDELLEDYTQYIPRGHYNTSEELQSYFKAMMWCGRLTFRAMNEDETRSAALILLPLSGLQEYNRWNRIYEPTCFFVGKSDDLGFKEYHQLMLDTYGTVPSLETLTADTGKWEVFWEGAMKLEPPAINSIPIFDETIQPDREGAIKGFRLMGQRFTLDAAVFQQLIYRSVKENAAGERRMLPKGLDIPASMGSEEAYTLLEEMGATSYERYPENMGKMQDYITGLNVETWTQNLYWSWLYTLKPLTEPKGEGYPSFMQNRAWTRRQLETYLGSWTELKHDTILYAKQVYAEMGGGGEELDDRGYVEPNPEVYARLAALTRLTIDGLISRDLLNEKDQSALERMEELALRLKDIAERELQGQPLTDADYDLIRSFGGQLEHFWLEAMADEGIDHPSAVYENPAALVADVATNPDGGQVLEEATGYVHTIYAVVPVEGELRIASGAVYSYYEFTWPAADRLTDQKWKQMLESGETPEQPGWVQTYRAPGAW